MADAIPPALTPDEWRANYVRGPLSLEAGPGGFLIYLLDEGPLLECECEEGAHADASVGVTPTDAHALMAVSNRLLQQTGHPGAFTRAILPPE